jgi:nucleotide-binding universal stress UspA family protein
MIELRRILCPVDFSDHSLHALSHAAALARWYSAPLTVLFVYRTGLPPAALAPGMGPVGAEALALSPADRERLTADLQQFVATAGATDLAVDVKLGEGDIVHEIVQQAHAGGADLIVVGTHGRSGFERLILGSVTHKLLRKAPCSVLTVPPASAAPPAPRLFARILVATDFSDAAQRAMTYALSLAQEAEAHLTIVHVVEMPDTTGEWVYSTNDMTKLVSEIMRISKDKLSDAVPASVRDWCQVNERLETGRPDREILRAAAEEQAALIVLGTHGHGMLDRFLFGSTAEHVVRQARCPVLAVRP